MTRKIPKITVVGSLNADLTAYVETLPHPGQTILSHDFKLYPGGKGANQAVAASRLGAMVTMVGCLGSDSYSNLLKDSLANAGVSTSDIITIQDAPTGMAFILVEDSSENEIIVIPGANAKFTPDLFEQIDIEKIKQADALLLQLEIPLESAEKAAKIAHDAGVPVILNPAPMCDLPVEFLQHVDILVPNQTELEKLHDKGFTLEKLYELGIQFVLETRGAQGVLVHKKDSTHHVEAAKVKAIDTVGAGDTFVAAFAVAHSSGVGLLEAVRFANQAAAYSTTRKGAQSSFPKIEELEAIGVKLP
ncbi:ribokinase [Neobacillus fumarioli]|uniref:ribokinase n=1 Tax=Neobacillus fumarioli TaxID=105229 RepID=UPI00083215D3|nr:ribokinase [Neobacillus fumarioli]